MKDQRKNNLLYFADDEIVTGKTENKKVFVTKRINGKETHVKQEKTNINKQEETEYRRVPNTQGFNFEREIVIGVNNIKPSKNNKSFNKPDTAVDRKNTYSKNSKGTIKKGKHSKKTVKAEPERLPEKNKRNRVSKLQKNKSNRVSKSQNNKNVYQNQKTKKNSNYDLYEEFEDISNKKKRKIKKNSKSKKIIITTISLVSMIIALAIMALVTPAFNIQEIKVEGNNKVSTTNIINLSRIKIGQNIFKNNKNKIISYIKENAYVEDAQIKRILPGTIDIVISERQVEYQVKLISSYIYIDKQGNILENAENKENVIALEGLETTEENLINGESLEKKDVQKLVKLTKVKEILKQINGLDLSEVKINIKNENDFIIYLKPENKKIYVGDSSNLSNKMLYIKKILENEKEHSGTIFINGNLNDGFKPYFREEEYKE